MHLIRTKPKKDKMDEIKIHTPLERELTRKLGRLLIEG
jgi:hypothetical protein